MEGIKKSAAVFLVLLSVFMTFGCQKQEESEKPAANKQSETVSTQEEPQEKVVSLPESIGTAESLIAVGTTEQNEPLLYTIGQNGKTYFYKKYVLQDGKWAGEQAEFQASCYEENSKMIVQRIFANHNYLYLVTAVILDQEKNTYNLFLYRYDKEKNKLKKINFDKLSYEDKDTKTKSEIFDLHFIDDNNFAAAYTSGKVIRYNLSTKETKEFEHPIYGNFCVADDMLYSSDMAKKNLIMLNLQSDSIDEKIAIDLGQNNYSFCTYNDEIYMACKSGIYVLDGNEVVKKVDGKVFSTYVIDENSAVLALNRDKDYFYVLFTQENSYKMYSYTTGEEN